MNNNGLLKDWRCMEKNTATVVLFWFSERVVIMPAY